MTSYQQGFLMMLLHVLVDLWKPIYFLWACRRYKKLKLDIFLISYGELDPAYEYSTSDGLVQKQTQSHQPGTHENW